MEQERYWMWTKQKEGINSHVLLSSNRSTNYVDSWEEQAFADDAAGPLGGCIWPPRSYTCSFCRRELRSAQALGGHMNVHRRDRARLKQSPSTSPNNIEMLHDSQILNPSHQICSMVSNPTSDNRDHAFLAPPPSSISSRVSILPMQPSTVDKKTLILLPFTSFLQDNLKSSVAPFSSWSKLDSKNYFHLQGLEKEEKGANLFESNSTAKSNQLTSDLSVNLSLVTKRSYDTVSDDKEEDLVVSCKRRLLDETLSFLPKRVSIDRHQPESEVLDELNSPSSIDILDLELRLGDRPK